MPYQLTLPNGKVVGDIPDNIPQDKALGIIRGKMPDAFSAREEARKGTYELTLPNGKVVGDVPEGMPREQALEMIRARMPDAFQAPERTAGDIAKDALITGARGIIGLPRSAAGLADIPFGLAGFGSPVTGALEKAGVRFSDAQKFLGEQYSPAQKEAMRKVEEAKGFLPTLEAGIRNPSVPLAAIGETIPQMLGGAGVAKVLLAKGIPAVAAVGAGEGVLGAGSAAAQMREAAPEQGITPKQSLAAIGLGLGTAAIGAGGSALAASKLGQKIGLADIDTMIAKGGAEAADATNAKVGFIRATATSGLSEGALQEMPQSAQEQMWQNWASDRPLLEGVPEASAMGLLTGTPLGAVGGAYQNLAGRGEPEAVPPQAAPIPPSAYFDEPSPLENPYGNITAEAMPDVADEINAIRSKNKQSPLDSFSIEDAVNAGLPQERVDSILSSSLERAGISPELQINPEDVYDAASVSGLDIEQPGFRDFLRRATGSESPEEMSPVQRVAALGAIQNIPEGVDSLPLGTNARSFTEAQYKKGLKAIRSAISGGASRDSLLAGIQKAGIKNPQDAQSILQNAIREGQVGAISTPAFAVFDDYGKIVRTYDDRGLADRAADRLNGSVAEVNQTSYVPPGQTEISAGEATGYQIKVGDSVLAEAKTPEEIDQKADRLGQIKERIAASRQNKVDQLRQQALRNTESLEELEARGLSGTPEYAKKQKQVAADNAKIDQQIGQLTQEAEDAARPMFVSAVRPTVKRAAKAAPVGPEAKPAETPEIAALRQKLLPALRRFGLEGVGLRVVKSIEDGGAGADGAYANRLIQIALSTENPMGVMRHEVIHALKELGAFKPREWRALEKQAKSEWVDKFIRQPGLYDRYQQVYQEQTGSLTGFDEYITEEAIAEAFKYFDQTKPPVGLIGNLFNRLRNFFASLRNAMQGAGFQTAEDVLGRIEEGKVKPARAEAPTVADRFSLITDDKRPFDMKGIRIYNREIEALVKKVGDRIAGMQSGKTLADVKAAVNKLRQYSKEGSKGAEWYERSAKAVLNMFNGDKVLAEKFFQIIAITSANTEVAANFTKTYNAWRQFAENKPIKAGTQNENKKIEALLYFGIDWDGRKTNTFYKNLMEAMEGTDSGRSTIDLHMARMLFDRDSPTAAQYQLAENMVRLLATKAKFPARQVQAASWVTQKAKTLFSDYRRRGLKKKLSDKELREYAFERAIVDYAHLIERKKAGLPVTDALREPSEEKRAMTQTITGEAIPSVKTEMGEIASMSRKIKTEITDNVINQNFVDKIAQAIGVASRVRITTGSGGYKGAITPNIIVQVVNKNPEIAEIDARAISAAMMYVFKQDAVPFFKADPRRIGMDQVGYRIKFARDKLTATQEKKLFEALRGIMGSGAGYTKMAGNEMVMINYRGEDGNPFLMPDGAFVEAVKQFRDAAENITGVGEVEQFGVQSEYPYHDWENDPSGAGLIFGIQGSAGGRPAIQRRLDNLRKSFVDSARESVRSAGITPKFSLTASGRRADDPRYGRRVTTDTIDVDGQERPTRTSSGTLIFPTDEGVRNFWRWFGDSVFVDDQGRPMVMYHGTAREIDEFIPKQANAIFITPKVEFAADFKKGVLGGVATWSENWMVDNYEDILTPEQIERAKLKALSEIDAETKKDYKLTPKSHHSAFVETAEFNQALLDEMPSRANVIPLFVKAENPFNYDNPNHVRQVVDRLFLDSGVDLETDPNGLIRFEDENGSIADKQYSENEVYKMLSRGYWPLIEQKEAQEAIRGLGFDGFSVQEALTKNYAVYDSTQVKSAIGNTGEFSPEKKGIRYSLSQTKTPEFKRWFGDSKVVDEDGNPLVVYHGTSDSFDAFSVEGRQYTSGLRTNGAAWFTPNPKEASWAAEALPKMRGETGGAPNVMPVYLSIKNPLFATEFSAYPTKKEIADLVAAGYDGVIVTRTGRVEDADKIMAFRPEQIKSAIGNRGTFDPANPDIRYSLQGGKAFELDPTTSKDNFVYLFADKNIDLKRVTEGVYKQGNKIADRWNAYEKEEAYYGRAAERIKQFATRDLHQLTKKMDGANISLQEMDDYLLARHAKEANAYLRTFNADPNQNAGMSDAEADAYMKAVPAAKKSILDRLAKDVDAITKGTRDLMVEYGLEDQKTVDQWAKTYKHYVPLFREETEESLPLSAGRGFSVRGSTSKRRTGSARKVVDVMANIALQREKVIARGEHNRVGNSLYGMVLLNPNPDFWSVIRPEKMTKDQLRTELFKLGIDPQSVDEMADRPVEKVIDKKTGMVTYNVPPFWKSNNNLLFTRINGKERIIAFNKNDERAMRLVTALKGMDAQKQAEVIKSMGTAGDYFNKAINFTGKTTRYFASINTQYNPAFGIYNLMRDVGGATINLQTTPLKGMERKVVSDAMVALKDIYKDLRRAREGLPPKSKWGRVFEDFGLQGGKSGFSELFKDSQDRSESLQSELKRFKEGKIKSKGRALMEWLSDFNEAIENAIRVSVYKNALDKGLSKQKAASLGKNITVNFNRTGAMSKHIQTLYAFFNAAIQGSARIAETLMTSDGKLSSFGKKFVTGGITLGMMQAVLLAMAGIDDDEIPEYIKDKSMVIPYGSGKYFSIPLPLGYHVIPAFGRRAMEFAMSDDKNVGKATISTAMMIADGFNPFGSATFLQTISPTALDPLVALAENKDFNSKPIAIEDVSSMSPTPGYERSSQNALAVTKAIAYGINILSGGTEFKRGAISPTADQIEYLAGQITGGVGREALKIGRGTESIVTGEELATYNIPIIGRLVGNTQQQAAQRTRFYDNIKTMNEHQAEMEGRLNSDQDVTEYLKKYPEAALSQEADKIYRKISQLRSEKEELKALGEGRESIKRIDDLILELMTGFNELKTNYSKEIKANQ